MFRRWKKRREERKQEDTVRNSMILDLPELNSISECRKCGANFDPADARMEYNREMDTKIMGVDPVHLLEVFRYDAIKRACPRCGFAWYERPINQELGKGIMSRHDIEHYGHEEEGNDNEKT